MSVGSIASTRALVVRGLALVCLPVACAIGLTAMGDGACSDGLVAVATGTTGTTGTTVGRRPAALALGRQGEGPSRRDAALGDGRNSGRGAGQKPDRDAGEEPGRGDEQDIERGANAGPGRGPGRGKGPGGPGGGGPGAGQGTGQGAGRGDGPGRGPGGGEPASDGDGDGHGLRLRYRGGADGRSREEVALERWKQLSSEERERLRERFEALQQLGQAQRERVLEEAHRLRGLEERIRDNLDEEERAAFEALDDEGRRQVLRELVLEEARHEGRLLLERLTPQQRERFRDATPQERTSFMERLRLRQEKMFGPALAELAKELGLPEDATTGVRQLPIKERQAAMLELIKRGLSQRIEQQGLSESISPELWQRVREMQPQDFLHAMKRLRVHHPELWPGTEADEEASSSSGPMEAVRSALIRAMQPTFSDRVEFAKLSGSERIAATTGRIRTYALDVLRASDEFGPEEIAYYESLPPRTMIDELRERFHLPGRRFQWLPNRGRGEGIGPLPRGGPMLRERWRDGDPPWRRLSVDPPARGSREADAPDARDTDEDAGAGGARSPEGEQAREGTRGASGADGARGGSLEHRDSEGSSSRPSAGGKPVSGDDRIF